jgi:hypothetical protein
MLLKGFSYGMIGVFAGGLTMTVVGRPGTCSARHTRFATDGRGGAGASPAKPEAVGPLLTRAGCR